MMNTKEQNDVSARLKKVEGQVRGIINMIDKDRYCIDILSQTRAVTSAIQRVEDIIMKQHLQTCVADSMKSENSADQQEKIDEIMDLFSKFRKIK